MRILTLRDLEDLGDRRFEELVAAIVLGTHRQAEQLGGADGGADVLLERRAGKPKGWQVKHYPRRIHWDDCIESLDSLVRNYGADEVVFVFPRDFGKKLKKSFDEKLHSRHPGVDVTYVPGSQLINELRQMDERRRDDLIEEFFGPDPRDQARALVEHLGSRGLQISTRADADGISERLEPADAAGRRDRYFRTEVTSTTGDAPAPVWEKSPAMVLTHGESDRVLRIAVWPEKDSDSQTLEFRFAKGKKGRQARWRLRHVLAARGEAKLPAGASVRIKTVPEAIRAISDVRELKGVSIRPTRSHPVQLVAEVDGERVERTMDVVTVPALDVAAEAEIYEFGCFDGALALFVCFRPDGNSLGISVQFDLHVIDTGDLHDLLGATRLLLACDEGAGTMEVPSLAPIGPISLGGPEGREERIAEHRSTVRLLGALITIRDALGVGELDLGDEVTPEQAQAALTAADVIERGTGHYEVSQFAGEVPADEIGELKRYEASPCIARFPVSIEVFGHELDLGIAEAELPQPTSIRVVDGPDSATKTMELRCSDEPNVAFKIVSQPGAPPPRAGIWLPGEAPPL